MDTKELIQDYDHEDITVGVLGSHSALDVLDEITVRSALYKSLLDINNKDLMMDTVKEIMSILKEE